MKIELPNTVKPESFVSAMDKVVEAKVKFTVDELFTLGKLIEAFKKVQNNP